MALSRHAALVLRQFFAQTARVYDGVVGEQFTATPTIEQSLDRLLVENGGWFMPYFSRPFVRDLAGQKVLLSVNGLTATRTDTSSTGRRAARQLFTSGTKNYQLYQVNNDIGIAYSTIDAWSKFKEQFPALWNALVKEAIANDLVRVGWHGTSAATDTVPGTSTNGEDVLPGWLEMIRDFDTGGDVHVDAGLEVGGGDFSGLDSLVWELAHRIPEYKRNDLVAYISDDLVTAQGGTYYEANPNDAVQKTAINQNVGIVFQKFGNLPCVTPPYFPDGTIFIAPRNALSYYIQEGSIRREFKNVSEKNAVEDYNSHNGGYVVYDESQCFLAENITIVE